MPTVMHLIGDSRLLHLKSKHPGELSGSWLGKKPNIFLPQLFIFSFSLSSVLMPVTIVICMELTDAFSCRLNTSLH